MQIMLTTITFSLKSCLPWPLKTSEDSASDASLTRNALDEEAIFAAPEFVSVLCLGHHVYPHIDGRITWYETNGRPDHVPVINPKS